MSTHTPVWILLLTVLSFGCESNDNGAHDDATADGDADTDTDSDTDADTDTDTVGTPPEAFALLVSESPPGPDNMDPLTWGGIQQYTLSDDGGLLVERDGIDATLLNDPLGIAYRPSSSEVFVSNRHGNNAADGVAGSIARFVYDHELRTFTANGEIIGNGLNGVHQINFHPTTSELFATNQGGGISRFTFDDTGASGAAVANGVIGTGTMRGVIVSPSGGRLYASSASDVIRQFDLSNGAELPPVTVAAGALLHAFAIRDGELYATGLGTNAVYRYTIDGNDDLTFKDSVVASQPVSVTFSQTGLEMFAAGHKDTSLIERFQLQPLSDLWEATTTVDATTSLGAVLILE